MASKGPTAAKLIAAMIFLTTLGVGGGFAAGLNRGRAEVREVEDGRSKLSRELAGARSEIARLRGDLFKVGPAAGPGSSETASAPPPMASAPGTAKASEKRAGNDLRENLRRIVRTAMAARKAGKSELSSSDPEMADPELQKAMMALMPYFMASQDPARAPEKYAELFSAGRDVLLEELGFGLSSAQKESLQVSSERIRDVLSRAQNAPLSERGITRLEAEREFLVGLRDVITPDQWARWSENQGMSLLAMLTSDSQSFKIVSGPEDAESVAKSWAARYRLDDAQELAARACARPFAESVTRFDREFSAALGDLAPGASGGSPPNLAAQVAAYDYRIQVLRAQLDTLGQLRGLLGPEAGDRIQSTSPMEFVGPGLKQALGGSAKK